MESFEWVQMIFIKFPIVTLCLCRQRYFQNVHSSVAINEVGATCKDPEIFCISSN